jgi:hypothetical protein
MVYYTETQMRDFFVSQASYEARQVLKRVDAALREARQAVEEDRREVEAQKQPRTAAPPVPAIVREGSAVGSVPVEQTLARMRAQMAGIEGQLRALGLRCTKIETCLQELAQRHQT